MRECDTVTETPRIPAWPVASFDPWLAHTQLMLGGGGCRNARKNGGDRGHRVPRVTLSPKVQTCTGKPSTSHRKDVSPFVRQESKLHPLHLDRCVSTKDRPRVSVRVAFSHDALDLRRFDLRRTPHCEPRLNTTELCKHAEQFNNTAVQKEPQLTSYNELRAISSSLHGVTPRNPESRATNFENFAEVFESSTS